MQVIGWLVTMAAAGLVVALASRLPPDFFHGAAQSAPMRALRSSLVIALIIVALETILIVFWYWILLS